MKCIKCLDNSLHPLGQLIGDASLCSGCNTHKEKDIINWGDKLNSLNDKCNKVIATKRNRPYDVIIPLNADAEDYFIVELALQLNLRPLLVYVNSYFGTELSWKNLHNLETHFDLDLITFNPNILHYKEAVRSSLRKFNSIYWPLQALKTTYPVKLALDMKIPLILWGGLQATEQSGKFSHHDEVEMSNWSRIEHDLFSVNEKDFFSTGVQIKERNQTPYIYPQIDVAKKVTGIYLSNYIRWDPWRQNNDMLKYGFVPEKNFNTFDNFERSGSSVYYGIHDLLRLEKHGYRKVRDHLTREVRHGRISTSDAKELYKKYLNQQVNVEPFFKWLGASKTGMKSFLDKRVVKNHKLIGLEKTYINPKIFFSESFFPDGDLPESTYLNYFKGI
jgi:hypothetical protein